MIQKITIFLMVLCLALCFMAVATAHANPGIVSVDSVDAEPGEQVAIPIRLSGFLEPLHSFDIYIKFDETLLTFDSGSFVNSIVPDTVVRTWWYVPQENRFRSLMLPLSGENLSTVGLDHPNGILMTAHFTVSSLAPSGFIPVDSVNHVECSFGSCWDIRVTLVGEGAFPIYPDFQSGGVNVKIPTAIGDDTDPNLPDEFGLNQNYPNPFNPSTVIEFSLPKADHVKLSVYNILGQEVDILASGRMSAGRHEVIFDGANHPSGIYFYRLQSTAGTETRKMILAK